MLGAGDQDGGLFPNKEDPPNGELFIADAEFVDKSTLERLEANGNVFFSPLPEGFAGFSSDFAELANGNIFFPPISENSDVFFICLREVLNGSNCFSEAKGFPEDSVICLNE